ncbi:amino acid adenylation domain-containing protein [Paenibacillus kandeliae]|uniref:amino acid adenylation domain-containing protein n=1 Tax=Paenibacillus kandeliae TaxID=3231269 RepID=UPI0034599FF9
MTDSDSSIFEAPMSYGQQRLWFLQQLRPDTSAYHIPFALDITGPLSVERFQAALQALINKHEPFRTRFAHDDTGYKQWIHAQAEVKLHYISYDDGDVEQHRQQALQSIEQDQRQPFSLATQFPYRLYLFRLADQQYLFYANIHHIMFDRASFAVFMDDLLHHYEHQEMSPLSETDIQYADYCFWQQEQMEQGNLALQQQYWLDELQNYPVLHLKPTEQRRGSGNVFPFSIEEEVYQRLQQWCRQEGLTLNMGLLSAYHIFLSLYSGQQDLLVATPVAGRTLREVEHTIGFFVNTVLIRSQTDLRQSFQQYVHQVKRKCLQAYANQDIPFDKLVELINPQRDGASSPLFQTLFSLQNQLSSHWTTADLQMNMLELRNDDAKCDLALLMSETDTGLMGEWQYDDALWQRDELERMTAHFQHIVQFLTQHPERSMQEMDILTVEEKRLIREMNQTTSVYPQDTIIALFERQAERTPDHIAIEQDNEQMTYWQLNQVASQLAQRLQQSGVATGQRVGIRLARSSGFIVSALAVLKLGGVYVPLDPQLPEERLQYIVQDSGVSVMIVETLLDAATMTSHVVTIPYEQPVHDGGAEHMMSVPGTVDQLAYIIYTSGSTGQPKGVAIKHRGVARLVQQTNYIDIQSQDRIAQTMNVSFDISAFEIWGALLNGAALVILPQHVLISPPQLKDWLEDQRISIMAISAALFHTTARVQPDAFRCLQYLLIGGEALNGKWVERVIAAGAPVQMLNSYGPSENTAITMNFQIQRDQWQPHPTVPIGTPVSNTYVYVLNTYDQPVPIGMTGELVVGGDGLAAGYWNRPELTAEKFVHLPHLTDGLLYRTGDLVQWRIDGQIEFIGRTDDQIKLRGHRIELGEVEEALRMCTGIHDAVALLTQAPGQDEDILAVYYTTDRVQEVAVLREQLSQRLPAYMLPSAWRELSSFALTVNGKIDRKQLPAIEEQDLRQQAYEAPDRLGEQIIADIWQQILGREQIGAYDHFFAIGGHSLLAAQVVSRLEEALQRQLSLRMLFDYPVLRELAEQIQKQPVLAASEPIVSYRSPDGKYPLSPAQQRLWLVQQLEPDSKAYHIPFAFHLYGAVDGDRLEQAIHMILNRHDSLRTIFVEQQGSVYQQVTEQLTMLERSSLHVPQEEVEQHIQEILEREAWQPLSLTDAPPLRLRLIEVSRDHYVLSWVIHHILFDGWSVNVLQQELEAAYRQWEIPVQHLQYSDYACWQREEAQQQRQQQQLSYWVEELGGTLPVLELATQYRRPKNPSSAGCSLQHVLPEGLTQALRSWSSEQEVTLPMTLLAAFQILLSRYSSQEEMLIGMPVAGRGRAEWENLIGFFVNTVVIRTTLEGNPTFLDYVQQVKEKCLNAYAHQDVSFERVVEAVQPERQRGYHPVFQVMFSSDYASGSSPMLSDDIQLTSIELENKVSKFDLSLHIAEQPHQVAFELQYRLDLFGEQMMTEFAGHWEALLHEIVAQPEQKVCQLPIQQQPASKLMNSALPLHDSALPLFDDNINSLHADPPLQHLFFYDYIDEMAKQQPLETAIIFKQQRITYSEMAKYANQIASYLTKRGYPAQSAIGVYMQKDWNVVPIVLGIMKAGHIFVPLDPQHPTQRIQYIVNDIQLRAVFVQQQQPLQGVYGTELLEVEQIWSTIVSMPSSFVYPDRQPQDGAYIIYTSGTTGKPKGILIHHRNLAHACPSWQTAYHSDQLQRYAQLASIAFDVFIQDMVRCLCFGGTLIVCDRSTLIHMPDLYELLYTERVEFGEFVPAVLKKLAAYMQEHQRYLPELKLIVSGADTWYAKDFADLRRLFHEQVTFINSYGVTEVTVDNLYFELAPSTQLDTEVVPIGQPFPHIRAYILDAHQQPVPNGVAGELYLGGPSVSQGYYNQPERTAEAFVSLPHIDSSVLYRTGDLVRRSLTGPIEFLGRRDYQVKIRGYRIETGEIEAIIRQTGLVRDARVTVKSIRGNQQLVAYLIPQPHLSGASVQEELIRLLKDELPAYMVPYAMMELEQFPLNDNGKIDTKSLPEPNVEQREEAFAAPQNDFEMLVADIWQHVLQAERIGRNDHFFEIGGHSLVAAQVISRLQQQLQMNIPLSVLFDYPVLAQMAAHIEQLIMQQLYEMSDEDAARMLTH